MTTKKIYDLKGNTSSDQVNKLISKIPKITDETIFITDQEILIKLIPLEAFKYKLKCQLSGYENNWTITLTPKDK
ncbi:MAG: hypothetical protein CL764_01900 [Chloroflexi bacterium]|nr:hypothetical protein [Chloroflexota bacterium]|tara:strand:- start:106 stop:330 length:225 start_codon:yes stop_codon:yes gene_type:complete